MSKDLSELVTQHHRRLLSFVRSRVESDETAEDILQSAYVKGLTRSSGLREDERLVAWFYRLLRNAIVDHYRRRAVKNRTFAGELDEAMAIPAEPDAKMEKAICACMGDLMKTLKPEYADALKSVELGEEKLSSFSKRNALTANNAAVRLHRARQSLKKRLVQTCGSCASHGCLDCHCRRV